MELFRFARDRGVAEIVEVPGQGLPPATLMRKILRSQGITDIATPDRQLGAIQQSTTTPTSHRNGGDVSQKTPDKVVEVDADDDLARQWMSQTGAHRTEFVQIPPVAKMTIQELRRACVARGIKLARTDNMISMRAKLGG